MAVTTLSHSDDWFHARLSGNYDKARWIAQQISGYSDDKGTVEQSKLDYETLLKQWEQAYQPGTVCRNMRLQQFRDSITKRDKKKRAIPPANLVRVAPAAIEIAGGIAPIPSPSGNTGGSYTTGEISSYISAYQATDETLKKVGDEESITKVDWLSVSFPYMKEDEEQRLIYAALCDFLTTASIQMSPRDRGYHGYTDSAGLSVCNDSGAARNVGIVAWSEQQGYFLELTGVGCDYAMKYRNDLYTLINVYGGRISRLDIALDLHSDYCTANGLTVPKFACEADQGVYRAAHTPGHVRQRMNHEGDWGCIIHGSVTAETYDPFEHAINGLTVYVGSSKSDNQVVFYEKGKQLLGGLPDNVADEFRHMLSWPENLSEEGQERFTHLCEKYELDPGACLERGWVRVERRFRRGSNKKYICPNMLLLPDSAFCDRMDGLEGLFQDYSKHVRKKYADVRSFRRVSVEKLEVATLTKKLYWAKQSVGSLIRTLDDLGYSAEQIVERMASDYPLKDIIFDLLE